jgi:thiol-disulfide isomerase/thioredoxin/DNA-binding beta-propeller fold protein YncE
MSFGVSVARALQAAAIVMLAWWGCVLSASAPLAAEDTKPANKAAPQVEEPKADEPGDAHPFPRNQKAPPLAGGVGWLNTSGPIDLKQLRGKFVLLDFWTYCCINCMHILPNLKQLEHAYPNEIVVIGVHSAKFAAEEDSKNIEDAVLRYEIEHPIVNDAHHKIWDAYGVQSWPTLMVIDPEGKLVASNSGEIDFASLDKFFKRVLPYYRRKGLLDPTPLRFELAAFKASSTPLRYPGKVLADEKSDRLFIADSNHNRIVVAKLDGTLVDTVGSGAIGATDGDYAKATFNHPQGMALAGDTLYVADTENHLLRKVDLKKKQVHTIAGTGKQGHGWPGMDEFNAGAGVRKGKFHFVGPPLKTAINSPWALWVQDRELYIAMAGSHQVWRMSLGKPEIGPFAGNGREDIVDGALLSPQPFQLGFASFAQPSGLSSDGKVLYVADSEGSSIRAVPFDATGAVQTIIGSAALPAGRLFTFGDVDGQGGRVRLQHALDVLYHDDLLYIADTYNNKIKVVDLSQATCQTLVGTGKAATDDSPAAFDEPAGLAYASGKLYVADTNNHSIRTIDLRHANRVATLEIKGLSAPNAPPVTSEAGFAGARQIELPSTTLKSVDGKIRLRVALELIEGYKLNPLAPLRYLVESTAEKGPIDREALGKLTSIKEPSPAFEIDLPTTKDAGNEPLKISLGFYYCQEGSEGVCKSASVVWSLPLTVSADATNSSIRLPLRVE